jgi:fluoroquinolone resistance protein
LRTETLGILYFYYTLMEKVYIVDKEYDTHPFAEQKLAEGEYENCSFINCDFSNADISQVTFIECNFNGCNFSLVNSSNTGWRNVSFKDCKLLGIRFDQCKPLLFEVRFEKCLLNFSSFYKLKAKGTLFNDCILHEVDFTEANMAEAIFKDCDLTGTVFDETNLEHADFRSARHYSIDPEINKIKKAKFSSDGIAGLLDKYDISID